MDRSDEILKLLAEISDVQREHMELYRQMSAQVLDGQNKSLEAQALSMARAKDISQVTKTAIRRWLAIVGCGFALLIIVAVILGVIVSMLGR